jgi:transketolase
MRSTFAATLSTLARKRKDIYLLTADLGFKLFDSFRREFPEKFINMGVAEQNMVGVAAGLSLTGKNVFCYSMIPFLSMRALEFIRIDLCYQNLNVKLIGVGCGVTYGFEGVTHHGIEDLAVMRAVPNMTVVSPGDPVEVRAVIEESVEYKGPIYVRLGGNNDPAVHNQSRRIRIGKGALLQQGGDITLFATGTALAAANEAALMLKGQGVEINLISLHTIKPLDTELISEYTEKSSFVVTVEEHSVLGGLGSAIGEVLLDAGYRGQFLKIGLPDHYGGIVGSAAYQRKVYGLTREAICERITERIARG